MPVQYIQVDSRHRLNHEQDSKIHVELSRPIERAKTISVQSFGTANEFHNVINGNEILQIITQVYDEPAIKVSTYVFQLGFYTVSELIAELKQQVEDNGGKLSGDPSISFTPSFDSVTGKTNFTFSGGLKTRCVLYFPSTDNWENSPLYRLGFSRQQVLTDISQRVFDRRADGTVLAVSSFKTGIVAYVPETTVSYSIAKPRSAANNKIVARSNGFETSNFLHLNCSLVNDFQVNSSINNDVTTLNTSILQRINIQTNRSSWINYESFNSAYEHDLFGKTVSHFWISMNDQLNQVYQADHFKNYSVTLKITSHDDDENRDINERSIDKVRELMFKEKHRCNY